MPLKIKLSRPIDVYMHFNQCIFHQIIACRFFGATPMNVNQCCVIVNLSFGKTPCKIWRNSNRNKNYLYSRKFIGKYRLRHFDRFTLHGSFKYLQLKLTCFHFILGRHWWLWSLHFHFMAPDSCHPWSGSNDSCHLWCVCLGCYSSYVFSVVVIISCVVSMEAVIPGIIPKTAVIPGVFARVVVAPGVVLVTVTVLGGVILAMVASSELTSGSHSSPSLSSINGLPDITRSNASSSISTPSSAETTFLNVPPSLASPVKLQMNSVSHRVPNS